MIIASIMTGTSSDGVDISIRDFNIKKNINFFSFDFTNKERLYIRSFLWPNKKNMAEISEFNFNFSTIVAKYFNKINKANKDLIEYVVYHGQTTFHDPNSTINSFRSTMQLGNGAVLANLIKKNVISDLRSSDVAAKGQGAPLVVYGDKELFWDKSHQTFIFNIGGISNVSIIQKNGNMKAYDLGMGNALLDLLVAKWFKLPYDSNGEIASKGLVNKQVLSALEREDIFLKLLPPKSTGKEFYNADFIKKLNIDNIAKKDIIRTISFYIAKTIASVLDLENIDKDAIFILAGGGGFNKIILKHIKELIPSLKLSNEFGILLQEREAAAFAVLGYYYLNNIKIGQTTGAKFYTIPGALYKYTD